MIYDDLAGISAELITEFGRTVTVHHGSALVKDLVNGTMTGTRSSTQHKAVVCTNAGKLMSDVRMVGNASIMTTDIKVLFPASVDLDDNDKIEVDGYTWAILKLSEITPGDVPVIRTAWLRR